MDRIKSYILKNTMNNTIQFFLLFLSIWLIQTHANTIIPLSTRRFQQPVSVGRKQRNVAHRRRRNRNQQRNKLSIYQINSHNLFW